MKYELTGWLPDWSLTANTLILTHIIRWST